MKVLLRLFAASLVFSAGPSLFALPGLTGLRVEADEASLPGDVLRVFVDVPGGALRETEVDILDGGGKLLSSCSGFRIPGPPEEGEAWAALIGVPSTLPAGEYVLRIAALKGTEAATIRKTVTVKERLFVKEDIPLNKTMSDLRSEQTPQKEEEARMLYELLLRFDPRALYHFGPLQHPVGNFRETSFYGDRRTYLYTGGGRAKSVHQGLDFASPRGTPVVSAGSGRIVLAKPLIVTGLSVVVEHLPGVYSVYFHLDTIAVKEGGSVAAGDRLGTSGATGLVTGPHLHWELRVGGVAVDPKPFLKSGFLSRDLRRDR